MGEPTSTVNYGYTDSSWGDLLTTCNGQTIEYDEIGNPLSVTDAQGNVVKSYTWERGRQLKTLTKGATTWTYTYDANGLRTGRTDGTNTFEYIYAGDKLVRLVKNGEVVDFGYAGGQPATMSYDGATYYYVLNGQGDVVALTDNTGKMIIGYHYSAYGFPTLLKTDSETYNDLKYLNPFMYRGYVFDIETTLYYLQSRYYDPELGRFINADALVSTGQGILGNNMFAYCNNNPVNSCDPCGTCLHRLDFWNDCNKCKEKKAAQVIMYDVPLYSQGRLSLCWAFCEVMIDESQSENPLSQKEARKAAIAIAKEYHGSEKRKDWNNAGWPTDIGDKVYVVDINELFDVLKENGPVYAFYFNYADQTGHVVVVTGVNLIRKKVYTNNPWGVSGTQSFSEFEEGVATKWWQDDCDMEFAYVYIPNG